MKKIVLIFMTFALIVMGCEHKDVYQTKKVDFDNIVPFASYEVPLKEGMVSIVIYGEDTLAITGIPMNINVPKEAVKNLTKSTAPIRVVIVTNLNLKVIKIAVQYKRIVFFCLRIPEVVITIIMI